LGRDYHHTRNYGEHVASLIDNEVKRMVEDGYNEALRILEQHIDILHQIADLLINRERVSGDEIRNMFPMGTLKEKNIDKKNLLGKPDMGY
jgi:cell division protease FtsH